MNGQTCRPRKLKIQSHVDKTDSCGCNKIELESGVHRWYLIPAIRAKRKSLSKSGLVFRKIQARWSAVHEKKAETRFICRLNQVSQSMRTVRETPL